MKYYIIAGESSGDLYGSMLMSEIKTIDTEAQFRFWGGDKMKDISSGQLKSLKETAFMGFVEVAKNAFKIRELFSFAHYSIKEFDPDIVILIDYPGFNLRLSKWLKKQGYPIAYYISPQLWAWKESRHRILRDNIDLFFVILPFEKGYYLNLDTPCIYHGHPLIEIISHYPQNQEEEIKKVGLFPGSRKQEIKRHLPIMVDFAISKPDYQFVIAGVSHIEKSFYLDHINQYAQNLDIIYDQSYEVMKDIDVAIACSGTTTLELALHNVPQIVIYKTNSLSFAIGKQLVKTDYISLVNIIAQKEVVTELLQDAFNTLALEESFKQLILAKNLESIKEAYLKIRRSLGDGQTSRRVAEDICNLIMKNS